MESPVRLLDEHAIVLRVSLHGTGEHLDGGPVDVFWPKREQGARSARVSKAHSPSVHAVSFGRLHLRLRS